MLTNTDSQVHGIFHVHTIIIHVFDDVFEIAEVRHKFTHMY